MSIYHYLGYLFFVFTMLYQPLIHRMSTTHQWNSYGWINGNIYQQ
jgi:hypothetical protein